MIGGSGAQLTFAAATLSGTATFNPAAGTTLSVGAIGGIGGILKTGAGTMVLAGGSFIGGTTVNEGVLAVSGGGAALGPGPVTLSGGVLSLQSASQVYSNSVSVAGDATIDIETSLQAQMGALSIGSNQLSMTGGSGAQLTFAAATLSGTATFNPAAGATLSVGALGGTGGIVKTGAGTAALTGDGSFAGGTAVNEGVLAVSGSVAALGSGPVTLSGGTLSLRGGCYVPGSQQTIAATGWNQDFVWASAESSPAVGSGTTYAGGSGYVYYEKGPSHNGGQFGLPSSRTFIPSANPSVTFQLQPYSNNGGTAPNALVLTGANSTGTLTLSSPGRFATLNLLDGYAWPVPTLTYTLNFADGTTASGVFTPGSWVPGSAIQTLLVQANNQTAFYDDSGLAETDLALPSADQAKVLASISFQGNAGGGAWLMAVSGQTAVLSASQTYSNAVSVLGDSTIDVQTNQAQMGALSIGNNQLCVTGASGSQLILGGATLSGAATFNTAAGATLVPGAIGGAGGVVKTGSGTLLLNVAANYSGPTTISAGTLELAGIDNRLPTATSLTIACGGVLDLEANNQTVGSLSGSAGAIVANNSSAACNATLTVSPLSGATTFAGNIIDSTQPTLGNIALVLSGDGQLTLSGTNTYTGGTTVSGGTLDIAVPSALAGSGLVTIAAGGRLVLGSGAGIGALLSASSPIGSDAVALSAASAAATLGGYEGGSENMATLAGAPPLSQDGGGSALGGPAAALPEPGTIVLLGVGAIGLLTRLRHRIRGRLVENRVPGNCGPAQQIGCLRRIATCIFCGHRSR